MRRVPHDTWSTIISVGYLGLMTNALLLVACLPVVVLLVTTDPRYSWPFLALAAPLCAPGVAAAFAAFRAHGRGEGVIRPFLRGYRQTGARALAIGAVVTAIVTVVLVDIRMLAPQQLGVVLVPALVVLGVLALATAAVALVAVAEAPAARLRDVLRAAVFLGVRRWYLSAVSLAALATQLALFAAMPAIAVGITAAPALYLVWANARFTLRPVLQTDDATAS